MAYPPWSEVILGSDMGNEKSPANAPCPERDSRGRDGEAPRRRAGGPLRVADPG